MFDTFFSDTVRTGWAPRHPCIDPVELVTIETGPAEDPDQIISLPANLLELNDLVQELAQVAYKINAAGKVVIDKQPVGFKSPNLTDSVCMAFAPIAGVAELWLKRAAD